MTSARAIAPSSERLLDGSNIRTRRERLGMTRLTLAARAGCSLTYLQTLEAGVLPTRGQKLAQVLTVIADAEQKEVSSDER